jgi:hypothetical protein
MKKKSEQMVNGNEQNPDSQVVLLTRRAAIKRLATVVGGGLVGAVMLAQFPGCASPQGPYSPSGRYFSTVSYYSWYSSMMRYSSFSYSSFSSGGYFSSNSY